MPKKQKSSPKKKTEKDYKKTTSKDVPGSGMAKKAAKAMEKRHKKLKNI